MQPLPVFNSYLLVRISNQLPIDLTFYGAILGIGPGFRLWSSTAKETQESQEYANRPGQQ